MNWPWATFITELIVLSPFISLHHKTTYLSIHRHHPSRRRLVTDHQGIIYLALLGIQIMQFVD